MFRGFSNNKLWVKQGWGNNINLVCIGLIVIKVDNIPSFRIEVSLHIASLKSNRDSILIGYGVEGLLIRVKLLIDSGTTRFMHKVL